MIPFFRAEVEDRRPGQVLHVALPPPPDPCDMDSVTSFWEQVRCEGSRLADRAVTECLDGLLKNGTIKRYRSRSAGSYYYHNPDSFSGNQIPLEHCGPVELTKPAFCSLGYASFEVAIPHRTHLRLAIHERSGDRLPSFIKVTPPWEVHLHSADVKRLKTQDNYRFKVFVGLRLPLLNKAALPSQERCQHLFRVIEQGAWEWRLIWECARCGFVCFCSCFQKAIEYSPPSQRARNDRLSSQGIDPVLLPFFPEACEVCRGKPSTHVFCSDMYARSSFEIRYGAYVTKKTMELRADGYGPEENENLEVTANNLVRAELGFPPIGEKWVAETELFRIVESIFPKEEVIHHYRGKWLQGLELDIYVPRLRLGIEYQGHQHFRPIDAWGGQEALEKTQERDKKKAELCRANCVRLIEFTFEEEVTARSVLTKLEVSGLKPAPDTLAVICGV